MFSSATSSKTANPSITERITKLIGDVSVKRRFRDETTITNFLIRLDSYKILYFILCRRRLSSPITDQEKLNILTAFNTSNDSIGLLIRQDLASLQDDNIYKILSGYVQYEEILLETLRTIGYDNYVNRYNQYKTAETPEAREGLQQYVNQHSILYSAITLNYKINPEELFKDNRFNIVKFAFCLLEAYVINEYIFDLELYSDTSIIRELLKTSEKRSKIYQEVKKKERSNYEYYKTNFQPVLLSAKNRESKSHNIFKTIVHNLHNILRRIYERRQDVLSIKLQKYTLILYLMGIKSLRELMESSEDGNEDDDVQMEDADQDDMIANPQIIDYLNDDGSFTPLIMYLDLTTGARMGLAGGNRHRIIKRLKSYK